MRASSKAKATFVAAAVLSSIGAVTWAQNLEVKGSAWVATGGSGSAGIGTSSPLGKLHVIAQGAFGNENPDGTSQAGGIPLLVQGTTPVQGTTTVFGVLNSAGRQAGAINVDNEGTTAATRGSLDLYDKADGAWHLDLALSKGNVGVGIAPNYKLDVAGDVHANGWLRTEGSMGWYSQSYGGGWYMSDANWIRTYNNKNVWTGPGLLGSDGGLTVGFGGVSPPASGAVINGSVGIGTNAPTQKLDVRGAIAAGNSDIYFTNAAHNHTGFGNTAGYAAIENAANYNTLMILGRSTPQGRMVDVWDSLQVNGRLRSTTGTPVYLVDSVCVSPAPGTLTTVATCQGCTSCCSGDSCWSCCTYFPVNNSLVGRLVDP